MGAYSGSNHRIQSRPIVRISIVFRGFLSLRMTWWLDIGTTNWEL